MIKISKDGKEYILEYDKEAIVIMEKKGFNLQNVDGQTMNMYPLIFQGAFYKNHKYMKSAEIDEIFNNISNRRELMSKLMEMIADQYQELIGDNGDKGNLGWESI
jgi:hypothetical protein